MIAQSFLMADGRQPMSRYVDILSKAPVVSQVAPSRIVFLYNPDYSFLLQSTPEHYCDWSSSRSVTHTGIAIVRSCRVGDLFG